ncbi:GyrI-like domain-containing protein [uncultured Ruminococcus sp.]|uniref:GyrI-like domain-containing protein n=1 Tax=uncultured Ruminococcus sp. TaxID=165186 RepID=UPI0025EE62B0|nr:GyrI-like domain-containing protein [uncultured Ruminococcus sp.]
MAFDFKKEYKEYYMPPKKPVIVDITEMSYIAVRGKGDPNEEDGEYKQAVGVLYAVAYTLKMSYKTEHRIEGFYEYVVPPLEGLWKQDGSDSIDYSRKDGFQWVAMIRLPDFITKADFEWAVETAAKKKNLDCSKAEYLTFKEELCVQMMHIGSYDDEPASVEMMNRFIAEQGYVNDICEERQHHEIYLSDPRKTEPSKLKTVIRHPIKKG